MNLCRMMTHTKAAFCHGMCGPKFCSMNWSGKVDEFNAKNVTEEAGWPGVTRADGASGIRGAREGGDDLKALGRYAPL